MVSITEGTRPSWRMRYTVHEKVCFQAGVCNEMRPREHRLRRPFRQPPPLRGKASGDHWRPNAQGARFRTQTTEGTRTSRGMGSSARTTARLPRWGQGWGNPGVVCAARPLPAPTPQHPTKPRSGTETMGP